jgi:hypothetical protein
MILAAAAIDFIDHLKKHSRGWVFEPLVVTDDDPLRHERYVTVLTRPNNHTSPYEFYVDHPPKGVATAIKAAKAGHYSRLIEMRLDPGPTAKVELRYWRVNGWKQNEVSHKFLSFYSHRNTPVQQSGETSFRVYAMERVTKTKRKTYIHRDVLDLAAIDSADQVARMTMATMEKSLKKAYGGGRKEKLKKWTEHLAIVMDGRNYHYDGHRFGGEIVYG